MGMTIRELRREDRDAVREMLIACESFSAQEVEVALEVLDAGFAGEYDLFGAELDGRLRGYVALGRTPMTLSTWHLYWICVHPAAQRRGLGRALQARAERFILARGGERIVLETSGRPGYEGQRRFYEQAGYQCASRIRDYYKAGDDCIFYCKVV
jgi:ribosomal protein S18 acetylase RimI-like enzyme